MRQSIDELNQIPPDYVNDRAKEIHQHEDEFNLHVPVQPRKEKATDAVRKVMLYLASIGLVTLGVLAPKIGVNETAEPTPMAITAEATPTPGEATKVPDAAPVFGTATDAPTQAPDTPTPEPTETPEPTATEPPLEGLIRIVVFSEFDPWYETQGEGYPPSVLAAETFDAATFTEYVLPPLPEAEGFKALGYVLLSGSGDDYLGSLYFDHKTPHTIGSVPLGDTLTVSDLGIVPKSIEGTYDAEVHTVWVVDESDFCLQFYDGDLFGQYYTRFPGWSEQLCYLAAFPTPVREGKTFSGWCDAEGRMIDAVTYFDFFPVVPPAESMEDRDWQNPIPCKLYACWSDGTGGAPAITPAPTAAPTPRPTPAPVYYTVTCHNCTFSGGGYSDASSGSVREGTTVTVYASSDSSDCYFEGTPSSASRGSYGNPVSPSSYATPEPGHIYNTYYYSYTYTVTDDTEIAFYAIIN